MINKIFKQTYFYFNKIRIIHSVPGRVRISVPGLNIIPEETKKYEENMTELILILDGIENIQYSYLTNNILINYNSNLLNDDMIIQWLNIIFKKIIEKERLVKDIPLSDIENDFQKLYPIIKKELISFIKKKGVRNEKNSSFKVSNKT